MIDLRSLARLSGAQSRSISPENFDGAKGGGARAVEGTGAARAAHLGAGWKISPSVDIDGHATFELAAIDGPALITHIWLTTHHRNWRSLILRAYWDSADEPAIEVPIGDFFGQGWCEFAQLSSMPVAVNPHGGFNSYWPMPSPRHARLTLENRAPHTATVYYQISYEIDVDVAGAGYLHTQFHRSNPLAAGSVHPILDRVHGAGKYVGTYLAWGVNRPGWWGEGEVKFYFDGDEKFPTICGTGTEDYFGGAWNFDVPSLATWSCRSAASAPGTSPLAPTAGCDSGSCTTSVTMPPRYPGRSSRCESAGWSRRWTKCEFCRARRGTRRAPAGHWRRRPGLAA
jgi:Protein of unknown function (DUF2961)